VPTGGQRHERAHDRHQAPEHDGRLAVALEPRVAARDLSGPHVNLGAVAFEQLQAPAAADRVGHPRANHRAQQPGEHDPEERQMVM
jgi:hypothetical protein